MPFGQHQMVLCLWALLVLMNRQAANCLHRCSQSNKGFEHDSSDDLCVLEPVVTEGRGFEHELFWEKIQYDCTSSEHEA